MHSGRASQSPQQQPHPPILWVAVQATSRSVGTTSRPHCLSQSAAASCCCCSCCCPAGGAAGGSSGSSTLLPLCVAFDAGKAEAPRCCRWRSCSRHRCSRSWSQSIRAMRGRMSAIPKNMKRVLASGLRNGLGRPSASLGARTPYRLLLSSVEPDPAAQGPPGRT